MVTMVDPTQMTMGVTDLASASTRARAGETAAEEDCTTLTSLPPEILVSIFLLLDFHSILALSSTCRLLHQIPGDFPIIQYSTLLQMTKSTNNASEDCTFTTAERLQKLKAREAGWRDFEIGWEEKIRVNFESSGIYDLTGGVYLLGNVNRKSIHWLKLPDMPKPEEERQKTEWNKITLDNRVVDIGLNVYEHDLLAVVTTSLSQTYPGHVVLSIHLLSLSQSTSGSGVPHPLAQTPVIPVHESPFLQPSIGIEIVGPHLVLVTSHPFNPFQPADHLYILNWQTGQIKLHITADYHTYSSLVFLDEETFIVPNTRKDTLDVWRIPKDGEDEEEMRRGVVPVRCLALPELTESHYISSLSCRGELNPVASTRTPNGEKEEGPPGGIHSTQPFHANPADAIIIFNIRVQTFGIAGSMTFSMFIPRSKILEVVPERGKEDECDEDMIPDIPEGYWELVRTVAEGEDEEKDTEVEVEVDTVDAEVNLSNDEEDIWVDGRGMPGGILGGWEDDYDHDGGAPISVSSLPSTPNPAYASTSMANLPPGTDPLGQPASSPTQTQSQAFIAPRPIYSLAPHIDTMTHGPDVIRWDHWAGPEVSRWFVTEDVPTRWITTSTGMRAVICETMDGEGQGEEEGQGAGGANPAGTPVVLGGTAGVQGGAIEENEREAGSGWVVKLIDFCPMRVMKEEALAQEREQSGENAGTSMNADEDEGETSEKDKKPTSIVGTLSSSQPTVVSQPTYLSLTIFREPIKSSLPYTVIETRKLPRFEGVLMDEERIVGLGLGAVGGSGGESNNDEGEDNGQDGIWVGCLGKRV